jgi:hypothetical protein
MDVLLLPGSRPCGLAAITHQPPPLLTHLSESELLYDWRFTSNQFVLVTSPLRLTTIHLFFLTKHLGQCPYVTSSLWREWVCRLQLLLTLASAFVLVPECRETHDHIWKTKNHKHKKSQPTKEGKPTISDSRLPQPGGPGPRIYIP